VVPELSHVVFIWLEPLTSSQDVFVKQITSVNAIAINLSTTAKDLFFQARDEASYHRIASDVPGGPTPGVLVLKNK
jgi:hypothetical protein